MAMNISASFNLDLGQALRQSQRLRENFEGAADASARVNRRGVRDLARGGGTGGGGGGLDTASGTREYRGNRGAAGLRGSATRDFAALSRMNDGSGLVAAYATLMAQVFALTSAFRALSDAAKTVQLEKGLESIGAISGNTLKPLARDLREISGYAINTAQSLRTVASATAAGIDSTEMNTLAKVAKGASIALGRDMADSMDRLTRGTIKLEPELLDELGIMTKITDAVKTYALENNKTVSSLTQTERRQAFTNAVMAEGIKKFGSIADSVPVSSFDKFSAAIQDLGTNILNFANNIMGPLLDLIIKFPQVILVAVGGIAASVISKLMPDMDNLAIQAQRKIDVLDRRLSRVKEKQLQQAKQDVGLVTDPSAGAVKFMERKGLIYSTQGGNSPAAIAEMELKTKKSLAKLEENLLQNQLKQGKNWEAKKARLEYEIRIRREVLDTLEKEKLLNAEILRVKSAQTMAENQRTAAINQRNILEQFDIELASSRGLLDTLSITAKNMGNAMKQAFQDASVQLSVVNSGTTTFTRGVFFLTRAWQAASIGVAGFGAAASMAFKGIMASLGPITLLITILMTVFQLAQGIMDFVTGNTEEVKKLKQDLEDIRKNTEKFAVTAKKLRQDNDFGSAMGAAANSMKELLDKFNELEAVAKPDFFGGIFNSFANMFNDTRTEAEKLKDVFNDLYFTMDGLGYKFNQQQFDFISGVRNSLEGFGQAAVDEYTKTIIQMTTQNIPTQKILEFAKDTAKGAAPLIGTFEDIASSAKTMNDTIIKLRTPDIFDTPLKPVADGLANIYNNIKNIEEGIKGVKGAKLTEALASVGEDLLAQPEQLREIARIGGILPKINDLQNKAATVQVRINALKQQGTKLSFAELLELVNQQKVLTNIRAEVAKSIDSQVILKVETEAYAEMLGQANLKLAQMNATYADLQANAMKQANSIAKMRRDIELLNKYGRKDFGPIFSGAQAVGNARQELEIAKKIRDVKIDVIKQEAALLKAQAKLQTAFMRESIISKYQKDFPLIEQLFTPSKPGQRSQAEIQLASMTGPEAGAIRAVLDITRAYEELNRVTDDVTNARIRAENANIDGLRVALGLAVAENNAAIRNINNIETQIALTKTLKDLEAQRTSNFYDIEAARLAGERGRAERAAQRRGRTLTPAQELDFRRRELESEMGKLAGKLAVELPNLEKQLKDNFDNASKIALENYTETQKEILRTADFSTLDGLFAYVDATNALKDAFNQQEANRIAVYNAELDNIQGTIGLTRQEFNNLGDELKDTIDASKALTTNLAFQNQLSDIKRTGQLQTDPLAALISGMGFDFGSNLLSARQQLVDEKGIDFFAGPEGEKKLQGMAVSLANATTNATMLNQAMQQVGASAAQAFAIMISSPKDAQEAFRQFILSTLSLVAQLLVQMAIMAAFKAIFDPGGTAASAAAAPGIISSVTSAVAAAAVGKASGGYMPMASGGIMSRSKPVESGIIRSPTYLVGEGKYDEAVVPLPNGRHIPVQMHGSNEGTNNISINVNMTNGSSNMQTTGNDAANLGAAIAKAVQKELLAQKAPGGILNKYGVA